jgi:hypothetical protein
VRRTGRAGRHQVTTSALSRSRLRQSHTRQPCPAWGGPGACASEVSCRETRVFAPPAALVAAAPADALLGLAAVPGHPGRFAAVDEPDSARGLRGTQCPISRRPGGGGDRLSPAGCTLVAWEISRIGCDPRTVLRCEEWLRGLCLLAAADRDEQVHARPDDLVAAVRTWICYSATSIYPFDELVMGEPLLIDSLKLYARDRQQALVTVSPSNPGWDRLPPLVTATRSGANHRRRRPFPAHPESSRPAARAMAKSLEQPLHRRQLTPGRTPSSHTGSHGGVAWSAEKVHSGSKEESCRSSTFA